MEIHALREMYAGQSCFLICDGPSFAAVDKTKLATPGLITMGVNNAPASFRTDLWIFGDSPDKFLGSIKADPRILKFSRRSKLNSISAPKVAIDVNTDFDPATYMAEPSVSFGLKGGGGGVRSVMLLALKTLYLLGFRNVYLLGVDFEMAEGKDNYHFEQETDARHIRMNNRAYARLTERFEALKPSFEALGFKVWNCNPESKLDVFPTIELDAAIAAACENMPDPARESTEGMYNWRAQVPPRIPRRAIRTIEGDKLKVVCVMRSGGDFDADDVANIKRHVDNHLTVEHEFVCYTDLPKIGQIPGVTVRKLRCDFPGWWSKLEIFRETGPCLFFDLDVTMVDNIDRLAKWVLQGGRRFAMIEEWLDSWKHMWNSSVMAWSGDYSYLLREFWPRDDEQRYKRGGDQEYTTKQLRSHNEEVEMVSDLLGVYSYKFHCKNGVPPNASIICFHGRPRPRWIGAPWWLPSVTDPKVLAGMDRMRAGRIGHPTSTPGILDLIAALPNRENMVELGCFRGISTAIFAHDFGHVTTVDRWGAGKSIGDPKRSWEDIEREARARLSNFGNVEVIKADCQEAAEAIPDGSLDFIYIDANHTYLAVKRDIAAWLPKLKPEGVLGGHDYCEADQGVIQAVNELGTAQVFSDSSWIIPVADILQPICMGTAGKG